MISLNQIIAKAVPMLEKTHLIYYPVNKKLLELGMEEKVMFWKGHFLLMVLGVAMIFIAPKGFIIFGSVGAIVVNGWWFSRWNRYLKLVEN